jgi:predicted ATPase with chaperone activity
LDFSKLEDLDNNNQIDFKYVSGQDHAKRALEIAAA